MLKSVVEINDKNKRFIATFTNGKTTKFGQSNPKIGTYIDHNDKTLKESMRDYNKRIKNDDWRIKI